MYAKLGDASGDKYIDEVRAAIQRNNLAITRLDDFLSDTTQYQIMPRCSPTADDTRTRIQDMKRCLEDFESEMGGHARSSVQRDSSSD